MLVWVQISKGGTVAPHAGAWIEILKLRLDKSLKRVAPHAGAWIEIRGGAFHNSQHWVAPHAGAWIEITREY